MRVLHICTEIYPILKTGGLADVAGALPPALIALGVDVRLLMPGFPALLDALSQRQIVAVLPARFGAEAALLTLGVLPNGVPTYLIEAPAFYDRPGNPYGDSAGVPYPDNDRRFALLGWVGAQLAAGLDTAWSAQICHAHDWHAGLCAAYLKAAEQAKAEQARDVEANAKQANEDRLAASVLTIHNLAFQGLFAPSIMAELGLPSDFYQMHGLEFYDHVSFLKAGLYYSDKLTTVSPTYAQEIQHAAQGCGMEGLLAARSADLTGILNGVDRVIWNPATDVEIAVRYDSTCLEGKQRCRTALQRETGLGLQDRAPLMGVISRLTDQKGLQLIVAALHELLAQGCQLVVLGAGEPALEAAFEQFAAAHPQSVAITIGYDEAKAHRIMAGCDMMLVPSRYEPCGLTQLYALAYGCLPLVRRVGGLADSVIDCTPENVANDTATGFVFDEFSSAAFLATAQRACDLFSEKELWLALKQCAMRQSFSWNASALQLLPIYRACLP